MFRLIDDDPAAATPQIDRRYLVATDRQFSPVAVLDEDGDIVERKMFEAYGRVRHSVAHDVDGDGDSDDVDLVSTDILAAGGGRTVGRAVHLGLEVRVSARLRPGWAADHR